MTRAKTADAPVEDVALPEPDGSPAEAPADAGPAGPAEDLPPDPSAAPGLEVTPPSAGDLWDPEESVYGDGVLSAAQLRGLDLLRSPLPAHLIGKKPVDVPKKENGRWPDHLEVGRCALCHGWLPRRHNHLDFAGHAAITERLLAADPAWTWEPVATTDAGLPLIVDPGVLWIRLTVCGVTRLGVGDAEGKTGGNAYKEIIGDALRNAAMRFGVGLELWHKGDLHGLRDDTSAPLPPSGREQPGPPNLPDDPREAAALFLERMKSTRSRAATVALHRDAGMAELLQVAVTIPDGQGGSEEVSLEDAFERRLRWIDDQAQS